MCWDYKHVTYYKQYVGNIIPKESSAFSVLLFSILGVV